MCRSADYPDCEKYEKEGVLLVVH